MEKRKESFSKEEIKIKEIERKLENGRIQYEEIEEEERERQRREREREDKRINFNTCYKEVKREGISGLWENNGAGKKVGK